MPLFSDIPTITIHPVPDEARESLRIDLLPALQPIGHVASAIDLVWTDLRRESPRLHDGPIILAEPGAPLITARRATYKTLATAAHVGIDIRAVGVQGVLIARDKSGEEHLLLGRRGSEVRIYQGLWENAPSGTLKPPPDAETVIDQSHFTNALMEEGVEELGLNLTTAKLSWIALLDDSEARSLDVVLKLEMHEPIDPRAAPCSADDTHRWEYAATSWTPTAQVADWAAHHAHALSPPTRAMIRWLFTRPG